MRKFIALILAAMLLFTAGCGKTEDNTDNLRALQAENEALRSEIAQLQQRIEELETGSIADWSLTGKPLIHGSGAEVTLKVTPTNYQEGQTVSFRVELEGLVIARVYCDWDGTSYTGSVELDAADGYSYSLLLTEPNGTQDYRELNSPANPTDPELVYMYSSLSASCALTVLDWQIENGILYLNEGSVDIQLPSMTATGETALCTGISLVLQLDGVELERKSVPVPQSKESMLSIPLSATTFTVPEMAEDNQLDLWLEVTLSDGQFLRHSGSSWFNFDGEMIQAVG